MCCNMVGRLQIKDAAQLGPHDAFFSRWKICRRKFRNSCVEPHDAELPEVKSKMYYLYNINYTIYIINILIEILKILNTNIRYRDQLT